MKKGNEIHNELLEGEGVDVEVNNAVSMAGTECFVNSAGQNIDLIGEDCVDQLASAFELLSSTRQSRWNALVTRGRTMLFIVNQDGSCMIVDSHRLLNNGAFIVHCPLTSAELLAEWFAAMLQKTSN